MQPAVGRDGNGNPFRDLIARYRLRGRGQNRARGSSAPSSNQAKVDQEDRAVKPKTLSHQ